ncbi:MAG TPA: VWA domain-containing protein [Terriglobales bacterium]|nr:VWA domain-containing protein [Terriglobales bacterium]
MKSLYRFSFALFSALILFLDAFGQSTPKLAAPGSESTPIFHSQSKLVVVDVVVTDKSGKPVTDLKRSDFRLIENGKAQAISVFEERSVGDATQAEAPLALPPSVYTNAPTEAPKSSINILLFDMLNTPTTDQQWAQQQMLRALQKLPPGQRVALFVLGNNLAMVQGVSGDSDTLIKAAKAISATPNAFATTSRQHQADVDRVRYMARFNVDFTGGVSNDPTWVPDYNRLYGRLLYSLERVEKSVAIAAASQTLDALEAIGRSMAVYPERKNLIWVTSNVPFPVLSSMDLTMNHGDSMTLQNSSKAIASRFTTLADSDTNFGPKLARTMRLLGDAQVAVYLVDVKGLPTVGMTAADQVTGEYSTPAQEVIAGRNQQVTENWFARDNMNNLAEATGGRAFTGSNDLSWAIDKSMEDGAHYYTLAYVPTNNKNDGLYRGIEITTLESGLKLAYRRGYFATAEPETSKEDSARLLLAALQPGMPAATSIVMKVQVLPLDASGTTTQLNYAVDPKDVKFQEASDQAKHIMLDFMAVAWDGNGQVAASVSDTLDATLKPDFNMASIKGGIPARQELELKPGKYVIGIGVMDRNTRAMGTMWVPLSVTRPSAQ